MEKPVKKEDLVCPKCGKCNCYIDDNDLDDGCLTQRLHCRDCDWEWREYFMLVYDGYSDSTGDYDKDGKLEDWVLG